MAKVAIRLALVASAIALLAAACADDDSTDTGAGGTATLELRREGGIAGLTEVWIIGADGSLLTPPSDVVGEVDDPGALFDKADEIGFFDLDDEYLPDDECCDRFTYRLTVDDGDRTHTVETMDGVEEAPAGLFALIDDILAAAGS